MQLRYVLTELRQALRRNVSMHIAVVLTLFVSLTLVGLGVLLQKQADMTARQLGNQLQVTFWLCNAEDKNPGCLGEVTPAQQRAVEQVIEDNPEVAEYRFESQELAFEKAKEIFGPERFEGADSAVSAEDLRSSLWVTLKDPQQGEGIISAASGLDGVSYVRDDRQTLKPIYASIDAMKYGALGTAGFLILAALLLVGNTIRLAALARRKEIGIMRLVGASTLYIGLPFLLEALVTAALGVGLAAGALAGFMKFGVIDGVSQQLRFFPWVGWTDFGYAVVVVAIVAPILTLIPTLLLTRKYVKI